MKIINYFLLCFTLIFSPWANAKLNELPECQRVGYTNCSVDTECHAIVYARGGMCIKLSGIIKGEKYHCQKSGVVAIDKIDYDSAKSINLSVTQEDFFNFKVDATQIIQPLALMMLGIYDSYDKPEYFTISCHRD